MSWIDNLQAGSWRGVRFLIDEHEWNSGRRVASHEYALRDTPSTEDMGRRQRSYSIKAYVLQDLISLDYFTARDSLRQACEMKGVGTLVHPYLGKLRVRLTTVKMTESKDRGGMATFDLVFVESGTAPIPLSKANSANSLIAGIRSTLSLVMQAYAIGSLVADRPGILFGIAGQALGSLAGNLLGLPSSVAGQLGTFAEQITANLLGGPSPVASAVNGISGDPVAVAVTDAFTVAAQAAIALQQPSATPVDPVLGQFSTAVSQIADPTFGLAAFGTWGAALSPPAGLQVQAQQQAQQAVIGLVQAAATLATAQIYAGIDWATSNAASAAKTTLLALLNAQLTAAAAIGNDALYQAWLSLTGLAITDLTERAQSLPSLTSYAITARLPAPVLAQLLYQDGSRGDLLAGLNDVIHPAFMPMQGIALSALPADGAQ